MLRDASYRNMLYLPGSLGGRNAFVTLMLASVAKTRFELITLCQVTRLPAIKYPLQCGKKRSPRGGHRETEDRRKDAAACSNQEIIWSHVRVRRKKVSRRFVGNRRVTAPSY